MRCEVSVLIETTTDELIASICIDSRHGRLEFATTVIY